MKSMLVRLLSDTGGQDLIEYALLTAVIGFAGLFAVDALLSSMGVTYGSWVTGVDSLWETPAPGSGS